MKYKLILSLFLSFAFLFSACGDNHAGENSTVTFYYIQNELEIKSSSSVLKASVREIDENPNDYFYLVSQYLNGPTTYDCVSPFPAGTTLEELHWDQNRVQITLSPHITTLSGIDLMIACACLTRTVSELTGINTVQLRPSSGLLNGEQVLTLTADSFMYLDTATPHDPAN